MGTWSTGGGPFYEYRSEDAKIFYFEIVIFVVSGVNDTADLWWVVLMPRSLLVAGFYDTAD
jgi:hypothetical protein